MRSASKLCIVALLLAVLLLSACGQQVGAKQQATATPALPTSTPFPTQQPTPAVTVIPSGGQPVWGKTASWSHANLPAGFGLQFHVSDLQVADSDGRIAYACAVPGKQDQAGTPRVVVTRNGGASWTYVTNIPVSWYSCAALVVDMLDPSVVIAEGDFLGPQEITFDGGKSWQALPLPSQQTILRLAICGQSAYALMEVPQNGGLSSITIFAESSDHLRTWHEIDGHLAAMNLRQFWINPGSGALLLQTYDNGLWTSTDEGAHWQQMSIPIVGAVDYFMQQPKANQPWRLCAEYYDPRNDAGFSLICTNDGGHIWFVLELQGQTVPMKFVQVAGIADDEAILLLGSPDGTVQDFMVYRLPADTARWQMLGKPPQGGSVLRYVASPHGDMLWMFPAESDGAGGGADPAAVFSAAYPY